MTVSDTSVALHSKVFIDWSVFKVETLSEAAEEVKRHLTLLSH